MLQQVRLQRVHDEPARHAALAIGALQIGAAPDDVDVGDREAARIARARIQQLAVERLEVRRFDRAGAEAEQRARHRRHLGRQMRTPEIQLEEPHRVAPFRRRERRPRERAQCAVVFVDGRHEHVAAHRRREIQIDPFEELARAQRRDEGHQLGGAHLQRHARDLRVVRLRQRALQAVGRHADRRAAVRDRRRVRAEERLFEHLALPGEVRDARRPRYPDEDVGVELGREACRVPNQ